MKKIFVLFCSVLLISLLFGCTNFSSYKNNGNVSNNTNNNATNATTNNNTNQKPVSGLLKIKDYYPIKANTKYIYEGKGNEYASYNVYIDYTSKDKVQQRVDNGGTVMAKVVEIKDGKAIRLLSRGEAYYRENLLSAKSDEEEVLLMEPLAKGTTWKLKDSSTRTITGTSAYIVTPAGSYNTIEVVTEGTNGKTIDYYAKNVGLVKSIFISGKTEITSSLSKIQENALLTQKISFFYPNVNDDKIYYKDKEISFKTNDITRQVLASAYREQIGNGFGKVFSKNTKINSLYLGKDNMVYIDLNKDFVTEMNAGSGYESMILQSIANTFGKYYNSEKVILTIDNNLYESGHIVMTKGQYIKVNYNGVSEIK